MNYVYLLRCADGTLYTGWTNNLTRRLAQHNGGGAGARYTRSRRPVRLVWCESQPDQGAAMRREAAIKRLTREQKEALVAALPAGERLTVLDANGAAAGELPRQLVHALGLRHAVCHLWLIEEREGVCGIWLQQRAHDRPLHPGMFDLAATGHLDPGETPLDGTLREAREEIGLVLPAGRLLSLGTAEQRYPRPDGGFDDEIVYAFAARVDETPMFSIGSEVAGMHWIALSEFYRAEQGAETVCLGNDTIAAKQICCLHKGEWALFEKHLAEAMEG